MNTCALKVINVKKIPWQTWEKTWVDFDLTHPPGAALLVGPNWFSTFTTPSVFSTFATPSVFPPNFELSQQAQFSTRRSHSSTLPLSQKETNPNFDNVAPCSKSSSSLISVCILLFVHDMYNCVRKISRRQCYSSLYLPSMGPSVIYRLVCIKR